MIKKVLESLLGELVYILDDYGTWIDYLMKVSDSTTYCVYNTYFTKDGVERIVVDFKYISIYLYKSKKEEIK